MLFARGGRWRGTGNVRFRTARGNTVWKTRDEGKHWTEISPDLTRKTWDVPKSVSDYKVEVKQRGVVYALAPSPKDVNVLWAGSDDGLIHLTTDDGKSWQNVTPKDIPEWIRINCIAGERSFVPVLYSPFSG